MSSNIHVYNKLVCYIGYLKNLNRNREENRYELPTSLSSANFFLAILARLLAMLAWALLRRSSDMSTSVTV